MPKVIINGVETQINENNLEKYIELNHGNNGMKLAVALNEEFIPKANYKTVQLNNDDKLEIVSPMSGG